jgi:hypothetical protein
MTQRRISPPVGERMAREQPVLHFLYRSIANASAAFDREQLRPRIEAMLLGHLTCAGRRDPDAIRDRRRGYKLSGVRVPSAH